MVALDLKNGRIKWVKSFVSPRFGGQDIWNGSCVDVVKGARAECPAPPDACRGQPVRCYNAYTAPTTVIDGIVFSGSNDGFIRAHDIDTGLAVWEFNTAIPVTGVNGITGSGGAINRSGSAVVDGMVYQTSGYGQGLGVPGNVLFAFEIPAE